MKKGRVCTPDPESGGDAVFWQVVSCVLAAAGILLFLWCLIGAFVLPVATPGLTAVYRARGEARDMEQMVRGFAWLWGTGVVELPLQIQVFSEMSLAMSVIPF